MESLESLRYPNLNYGDAEIFKPLAIAPLETSIATGVTLTPKEALVYLVTRLWLDALRIDDEVAVDEGGHIWGKLPAEHLSRRLQNQLFVSISTKQTRTSLNGLVEKGILLRAQLASKRWDTSYFYRLPPELALPTEVVP